ncbi:SOS response-associated peptidase family protein [Piscinibacter defluvii]|uniref:SOS response-associated peptidase family protein n=1 Tax=Piscinibacter defluvii TaxID=1796922 RepID=UPI000FDE2EFB|nr:SOS response-associated peptidase family protein [Piscinibacter defluvii]
MCYSARIIADYRKYVRMFGAQLSIKEFVDLFWHRRADAGLRIPKAMEAPFLDATAGDEAQIRSSIEGFIADQKYRYEEELFKQRARLSAAQRKLAVKPTKGAAESERIATSKIEWSLGKLNDLRRTEPLDRDARIFPGWYALVMIEEEGQRVVKPMRYQCRPAGKPAFYDTKYPGTYNARRDNLTGFWKEQFGHTHGVMLATAFFENVARHKSEHRDLGPGEEEENLVLEFRPRPEQEMLVACLWSRWSAEGQPDLLSFAAITDEPPAEVAAAGHDRCIVPLRRENLDAWLRPDPRNLEAQFAIIDDRERPYYEHRMAA